ncbi:pyridoxal phosphate-dependent aminotransferase [candidate division KSB1 bacterium]|nr:pyridoxal phosphate-dependent aminotransferase [candidate division KSB1 bacterium]RQW01455.1 MAG: pyridoxal phosphate-dependent aminotransferase [candidate division KSB1 bacterium]
MSIVTAQIADYIQTQSWIRRMFEVAAELKAQHGAENVFDFSLGNPDVPPPAEVGLILRDIADIVSAPLALGYCPNAGLPDVRAALADKVSHEQGVALAAQHIIITSGAAGALNTILRATLDRGDQIICFAPYFVEYGFYAANHGGTLKSIRSKPLSFEIDVDALRHAISPNTRAMIINSPNNPTGVVYSQQELDAIANVLREKSHDFGRPILLISDEPYRFLTYDNVFVPPVLSAYEYSIVVNSFSKSLSMAGERIGYIAVNPHMTGVDQLLAGMILANRILGFVNAPILGQRIILNALHSGVDVNIYEKRRQAMADILDNIGLEYTLPKGAFYFFPKAPEGYDDKMFVDVLMTENIIAVPGAGFGYPGYFRLTYCIDKTIIENSKPAWQRAMAKLTK